MNPQIEKDLCHKWTAVSEVCAAMGSLNVHLLYYYLMFLSYRRRDIFTFLHPLDFVCCFAYLNSEADEVCPMTMPFLVLQTCIQGLLGQHHCRSSETCGA